MTEQKQEPVAVKVKPLTWTPWSGSISYAYSDVGDYTVELDYDHDMAETPFVAWAGDSNLGHFATLKDAQNANLSEHERRIRSEIEPAPDLAAENARLRRENVELTATVVRLNGYLGLDAPAEIAGGDHD